VITPMDQLMLVGRRGAAHEVLVALQGLGVVQVDPVDLGVATRADEAVDAAPGTTISGIAAGAVAAAAAASGDAAAGADGLGQRRPPNPAALGTHGLARFQPSAEDTRARTTWDRIATRCAALLETLEVSDEVPVANKGELPADPGAVAERVDVVASQVDQLVAERAQVGEELEGVAAYLPTFRDLAPTLAQLEASRYLHGAATIVASTAVATVKAGLREALEGRVAFEERPRGTKQTMLVMAVLRREAAALRTALARHGLAELQLPERYRSLGVAKAVHTMEERQGALPKRLASIAEELRKLALQHGPRLKAYQQTAINHRERLERMLDLAQGRYAFALKGWVPQVDRPRVTEALRKQFGDDLIVRHRPADEHHDEGVPVRLENAAWARPFQGLLSLFAPPRYGNFDPTWTLAVFFPLFFGVIVGDIGFGLLFAVVAFLLRRRAQQGKALSLGPLNMVIPAPALRPISSVIFWAAGWTIVWGYVYGEFFGTFLEYWPKGRPVFYTTLHHEPGYGLIEIMLFRVEVFTPLILLAIGFGVLQILGGWVIRVIYGIKHNDMKHVYEGIGMFTGIAAMVIFASAFLTDNLNPVVNGIVIIGFAVFAVCVVLARMPLMLIELVSNGGNILSYLRIFAVGLAAALVAKLATELGFAISGTLPVIGPILGILVGLFVHLLALVLKVIGYTLQPLRLQYVEFYTKFGYYEASGRPYQPFKLLGGKS
jgi:V/A-type H+/Na+-transporting ATPase subunit I